MPLFYVLKKFPLFILENIYNLCKDIFTFKGGADGCKKSN